MTVAPKNDGEAIVGGAKKILYALATMKRMGLRNSAKALNSHNACKACGLGMGGQRGGMVNEEDEYPSVCNKSIQAQSTDIQPAIPEALFEHPLTDFNALTDYELEHLGRLGVPIFKAANSQHFEPVSWAAAIQIAIDRFKKTDPERTFFYSSGRSSNEAGFVLQLLARLYGTNNINNCSYYCHQASGVGLDNTIGTGTSTVELSDLNGCDTIFVIGANPASNHPRFIYKLKACRDRGGRVVIINPAREPGLIRFALPKSPKSLIAGGSEIATDYVQPKIGGDIALLKGICKSVLEQCAEDREFIVQHTTGFEAFLADITLTTWSAIEASSGIEKKQIHSLGRLYAKSKNAVFAWGMGVTHHQHGVDNVEMIAALALLRGMIGRPFAGLLPLRGHSNVQGIGTIGVKPVLAKEVFQKIELAYGVQLPTGKGMDTLACLEAADRGELDAALLMGGNLFGASPDRNWTEQALNKIGFKLYLTTTLNRGHIRGFDCSEALVLPVLARDEETQSTTQESMFSYVRLSDGGIDRLAGPHSEVAVLCDLADGLLPNSPVDFGAFRAHKKIREAIAVTVPGMEALADIDTTKQEFHVGGRLLHAPVFNTANGKARFSSHEIPDPNEAGYPFLLTSVRSEGQFNTIIYEEFDSYRNTSSRWTVLMNEKDMQALTLRKGDRLTLASAHGEMRQVAVQAFDLPAGNMMAYFPEANVLIGRRRDPKSLTPAFKSVPVRISG